MTIQELYRMRKPELLAIVNDDAKQKGRRWVLGGPEHWSKDDLISHIVRETDLEVTGIELAGVRR